MSATHLSGLNWWEEWEEPYEWETPYPFLTSVGEPAVAEVVGVEEDGPLSEETIDYLLRQLLASGDYSAISAFAPPTHAPAAFVKLSTSRKN